ncbi:DUF4145 domain-containing protein [Flavobacterium sp.]|uniref:DUF4145 domain-containing protein n=1 Tax=Flavobacterium sp. TaxID=239 RepID=UPI0040333161
MYNQYLASRAWAGLVELTPQKIACGYCDENAVSHFGYQYNGPIASDSSRPHIYICPNCGCPLFFDKYGLQNPGEMSGRDIDHLPEDVDEVYNEIRDCIKHGCYTASIMLGRKLIMHVSVNKAEANAKDTFQNHISHLKEKGYIPPNAEKLFDFIRKLGNEQNHEIVIGDPDDAEKMLRFIEMILLFIYEMPNSFEE